MGTEEIMRNLKREGLWDLNSLLYIFTFLWLYLGFVRVYLLPQYSNFLYFLPVAVLGLILFKLLGDSNLQARSKVALIALSLFTLSFQISHFLLSEMSLTGIFYGWAIYAAPVTLFFCKNVISNGLLERLSKLIFSSIPVNGLLSVLQTYSPNSRFNPENDFVQIMTSSGGFARAYGTFTHPTGFACYLSIALGLFFWKAELLKPIYSNLIFGAILLQTIISGSRTALSYCIFVIAIYIFLMKKNPIIFSKRISRVKIVCFIIVITTVGYVFFRNTVVAVVRRIIEAAQIEDSGDRLISTFDFFYIYKVLTIWGEGLGARSFGSVKIVNAQWIESAYVANFVEGGLFVGSIFFVLRLWSLHKLATMILFNRVADYRFILAASVFPIGLFGTIFGQATVSQGYWLVFALVNSNKSKLAAKVDPIP